TFLVSSRGSMVVRYNGDWTRDTTFGNYGNGEAYLGLSESCDMWIDVSGRIVRAGERDGLIAVTRMTADGKADTTFGLNGLSEVPGTNGTQGRGIAYAVTVGL